MSRAGTPCSWVPRKKSPSADYVCLHDALASTARLPFDTHIPYTDSIGNCVDHKRATSLMPPKLPTARRMGAPSTSQADTPSAEGTDTPSVAVEDSTMASSAGGALGAVPKAPLKFKPKVLIRRSQAERERAEVEEQVRLAVRFGDRQGGADGMGRTRGGLRGRGPRGRGMGMGMGFGRGVVGSTSATGVASGPFGAGSAMPEKKGRAANAPRDKDRVEGVKRGEAEKVVKERREAKEGNAGESSGGKGRVGGSGAGGSGPGAVKREPADPRYTYMSSDDDDDDDDQEGPRVDIERINLVSSDEEEEGEDGKTRDGTKWGLKPVRLDRREHRERGVGVSTEATDTGIAKGRRRSSATKDDGLSVASEHVKAERGGKGRERAKDVQFLRDERRWRGVYQDDEEEGGISIKSEPTNDDDAMNIDPLSTAITATESTTTVPLKAAHSPKQSKPIYRRKASSRRLSQSVLQTPEDMQEYARQDEDIRLLIHELGSNAPFLASTNTESSMPPSAISKGKDDGDDTLAVSIQDDIKDLRFGRVYLFQFPPILPMLYDPAADNAESTPNVAQPPTQHTPIAPRATKPTSTSTSTTTTAKSTKSTSTQPPNPQPDTPPVMHTQALTAKQGTIPRGRAGKMYVRASGKVDIIWGCPASPNKPADDHDKVPDNEAEASQPAPVQSSTTTSTSTTTKKSTATTTTTSLELNRGIDAGFLQDVVLANLDDDTHQARGAARDAKSTTGVACGISGLSGKFVVTPGWEDVLR